MTKFEINFEARNPKHHTSVIRFPARIAAITLEGMIWNFELRFISNFVIRHSKFHRGGREKRGKFLKL